MEISKERFEKIYTWEKNHKCYWNEQLIDLSREIRQELKKIHEKINEEGGKVNPAFSTALDNMRKQYEFAYGAKEHHSQRVASMEYIMGGNN